MTAVGAKILTDGATVADVRNVFEPFLDRFCKLFGGEWTVGDWEDGTKTATSNTEKGGLVRIVITSGGATLQCIAGVQTAREVDWYKAYKVGAELRDAIDPDCGVFIVPNVVDVRGQCVGPHYVALALSGMTVFIGKDFAVIH